MIVGIGTDIIEIERIAKSITKQPIAFAERVLTPSEMEQFQSLKAEQQPRFLAKRFAAKEAISKALGTGIGRGVSFQHIQIDHDDFGKPVPILVDGAYQRFVSLAGGAKTLNAQLSISDEIHYAQAFAILESIN